MAERGDEAVACQVGLLGQLLANPQALLLPLHTKIGDDEAHERADIQLEAACAEQHRQGGSVFLKHRLVFDHGVDGGKEAGDARPRFRGNIVGDT